MVHRPRQEEREYYGDRLRIALLEHDADQFEADVKRLAAKLDRILLLLVGILISLATGAVLMALNLLASAWPNVSV